MVRFTGAGAILGHDGPAANEFTRLILVKQQEAKHH